MARGQCRRASQRHGRNEACPRATGALHYYCVCIQYQCMSVALHRRLNARNIVLEEGRVGQTVGVRRRAGDYAFLDWGGFVDRPVAKALPGARSAKLGAVRVGVGQEWALEWETLEPGQHVLGCVFENRAYAVLDNGRPVVV